MNRLQQIILLILVLLGGEEAFAESITYRIVEYNADAGAFVLSASGQRPVGSYVIFDNEYGATRGNRYNQIPRNRAATLWLEGWEGCTVRSVTLSMCSNNTSGTAGLTVATGDLQLFSMRPLPFDAPEWFGHWLSKDLRTYAEITKEMTTRVPVGDDGEVAITLKGGTPEGSVYLDAVTIDYEPAAWIETESPLGWVFEKLEAKSTLSDGDVVMLYRSGDAAGDIDGMEQSRYLDAIGLASTSNVAEPFVINFTAHKTSGGHWTLTNQYGQQLAAAGAQDLRWDAGVVTWDITLGYSGATIASTNSKYGTLRYNAPAESYPRFWNYTSNSLPLPYLYRRVRQLEPVACASLDFPEPVGVLGRTVDLAQQDTIVLRPQFVPANVTDRRLSWRSTDESVATVKSGVVFLHAPGKVTIEASVLNWSPEDEPGSIDSLPPTAYCELTITDSSAAVFAPKAEASSASVYNLKGQPARRPEHGLYIDAQGIHFSGRR